MNANELAKYLDRLNGYMDMPRDILDITQPAATMLRQQQAEIEALKKTISSLFGGLEASLDLNKAQAIRKATDA